ncbi:ATP-binding cassette domain-containing protein [bacterium]|nr:MAG: ATP-binding cassette domain-containing protein [bacterium]
MDPAVLLRLESVRVSFGGVRALDGVSFAVEEGSIHGLIGPNGAGKTTALNVATGLVRPTAGRVTVGADGREPEPRRLIDAGIARAFQTPAVFEDLNAVDNVLVGAHRLANAGLFRGVLRIGAAKREERTLRARAEQILADVGFDGRLTESASTLSFGNRRRLELARCLISEPRLLLLDEPTAGLSGDEVRAFADLLRALSDRLSHPVTILIVEHNVPLMFSLCTKVTALAEGRCLIEGTPQAVRHDSRVIEAYLGRPSRPTSEPDHATPKIEDRKPRVGGVQPHIAELRSTNETPLRVAGLYAGYGNTVVLRDVHIEVWPGEVVAMFGRNGAGKSTLMSSIVGAVKIRRGQVTYGGSRIDRLRTDQIVNRGIGFVPQGRATIESQSVDDNLLLSLFGLRLSKRQIVERRAEIFERFPRLAGRQRQLAGTLSGGERQMLAIAKATIRKPALLLLDEPSTGLAPAIVTELQDALAGIARDGTAILIAEQAVDWVVPLANRAYWIESGRVVRESSADDLMDSDGVTSAYLGDQASGDFSEMGRRSRLGRQPGTLEEAAAEC